MVSPQAHYTDQRIERIVVLHDGPNPSTDIYLRNRLAGAGLPPAANGFSHGCAPSPTALP